MSVIATDTFTRADGGLGGNWTTLTGMGAPQISTNRVRTNAVGTDSEARYSAASWPNDQYAQVKAVLINTSRGGGPLVRCSSSAETMYGAYVSGAFGAATFFATIKSVAGAHSNLATTNTTVAANDVIRVEVQGNQVSGYINGTLTLGPTSDSSITSGDAGLLVFVDSGTTADAEIDDWEGGDFTTASSSPIGFIPGTKRQPGAPGPRDRLGFLKARVWDYTLSTATTFNDSVAETLAASDSETAAADFVGANTEALTASESSTGALTAVVAGAETLTAADSATGALIASGSATETLGAADSETGALTAVGATSESLTATSSETSALVAQGLASESLSVADATGGAFVAQGLETESLAASDSEDATVTPAGASTSSDTLNLSATETATVTYAVTVAETLSVADTVASVEDTSVGRGVLVATAGGRYALTGEGGGDALTATRSRYALTKEGPP